MNRTKIGIISVLILLLFSVMFLYILFNDDYADIIPEERAIIECNTNTTFKWINLTITNISSDLGENANWKEPINWSQIDIYYYESSGMLILSSLLPNVLQTDTISSFNDYWFHSDFDDKIDINDAIHVRHSIYGSELKLVIYFNDSKSPTKSRYKIYDTSLPNLNMPYQISGFISNNTMHLKHKSGAPISSNSSVILFNLDNQRKALYKNFTINDVLVDTDNDNNWSKTEDLIIPVNGGFLNNKWNFCFFVIKDKIRQIDLVERAYITN